MGENIKYILSLGGTLLMVAAVFFGAYVVSKMVARGYSGRTANRNLIEITASAAIGKGQSLLIVRTAGKAFLLGVSEKSIQTISELDPEGLPAANSETPESHPFFNMFEAMVAEHREKKNHEGKTGNG